MNDLLSKAILAMDSYNRGYGAGIKFGTSPNNSDSAIVGTTKIGDATFSRVGGGAGAEDAGFYAIAYQTTTGTVISYRGTDQLPTSLNPLTWTSNHFTDIWDGWGIGAGSPLGKQAALAFDFYNNVADGVDPSPMAIP